MVQFKLSDYVEEIHAICNNNGCTVTAAVDRFIINLNTFNEYNKGTGTINYHFLGQLWGALPASEKVSQKRELKQTLREESEKSTRQNRRR